MKAKVEIALDRDLLQRAKATAAQEGKRLNQVIEEALSDLLMRKSSASSSRVVARTAGCLKLSKSKVDRILREEPRIFDR